MPRRAGLEVPAQITCLALSLITRAILHASS